MIRNPIYLFLLSWIALFPISLVGAEKVPASDIRITFVGRTEIKGDSVCFDWTGTYLRVAFRGNYLRVRINDTHMNYYNVYVDHEPDTRPSAVLSVMGDTTWIIRPSFHFKKEHTVVIQKRTEAEQGKTTFIDFETDGCFLQAESLRDFQIEFIGDSYMCGYGIESLDSTEHFMPETENVCKSFVSLVANQLKADYHVIAHSGMGIFRNYNSKFEGWTMPVRYRHLYDMDSTANTMWQANLSLWKPDMVIIMLGGNDFSVGITPNYEKFRTAYIDLLTQIRANYGKGCTILCCAKNRGTELSGYVEEMVSTCGMDKVYFFALDFENYTKNREYLGADKHPNEKAHKKMAEQLLEFLPSVL